MSPGSRNPTKQSTLEVFFRHHLWSNLRLFDACLTLTDKQLNHSDSGTFGSIRSTLIHLVRSEEYYLFLLAGQEMPTPESDAQTPISELKERVRQSGMMLLGIAPSIQPDKPIQVGEGEKTELIPAGILVLQAIHHAHEHRTQIATLFGQQQIEPPALSGWSYFDKEMAPQQK